VKKKELIEAFAVGTSWRTQYLKPLRQEQSIAPDRTGY
jgi:hypothetical protein